MTGITTISTIDLQPLSDGSEAGIDNVAMQLKKPFATVGFAYLTNYLIPETLIDAVFSEAHRFHALPLAEKLKIKHNDSFRGYMPNLSSQIKVSTEGVAKKPNLVDSFVILFEADESHPDYKDGLYFAGPNQPNFSHELYSECLNKATPLTILRLISIRPHQIT